MATAADWTNPSVIAFAGDQDPIEAIERRARETVLRAFDRGWSGPPFDPIRLAEILNISIRPDADVLDARTVPTSGGQFRIEFNPQQSRGRVRFSVAHEIAHTFFPDCASAIRHRGGRDHSRADDWQLEMLCNIAAAEITMPIGDVSRMISGALTIEQLMHLRREFDVSAEATLIRVAKITDEPVMAFCASRIGGEDPDGFRLDYVVRSRTCPLPTATGSVVGPSSVLRECTAIGYTAHRVERWPSIKTELEVQCVGLPPYPGMRYPRVAGMVKTAKGGRISAPKLEYRNGDALASHGSRVRAICHVVNDGALTWGGAGFAANLRRRYPEIQEEFRKWVGPRKEELRLGNVHFVRVDDELTVASMVAQRGYGPSTTPRIRYRALEQCLETVANKLPHGTPIDMPRIGTGAARGSWPLIEAILVEKLLAKGFPITVYDLPERSGPTDDLFGKARE